MACQDILLTALGSPSSGITSLDCSFTSRLFQCLQLSARQGSLERVSAFCISMSGSWSVLYLEVVVLKAFDPAGNLSFWVAKV